MESTDNQDDKINIVFLEHLNSIIDTYYNGKAKNLAEELNISKAAMSSFTTGRRLPVYNILYKLVKRGISIDYLMGSSFSPLINNSSSLKDAQEYLNNSIINVEVKDDKMSPTIELGDIVTVKKISLTDFEVGGVYCINKRLGGKFIARLISDDYDWVYDNKLYNSFNYIPTEKDDFIGKLIQKTSNNFSAPKIS